MNPESAFHIPRWVFTATAFASAAIGVGLLSATRQVSRRQRVSSSDEITPSIGPASCAAVSELRVKVASGGAGRTVTVSADGQRSTRAPFLLPPETGRGGPYLANQMAKSTRRRLGRRGRPVVEDYGSRLFDALFPEPVRSKYQACRAKAASSASRLRILLDLDDQTTDLPWEYLYDSDVGRFLAMSQTTSLIRFCDSPGATHTSTPVTTLKVLVMTASPSSMAQLDTDSEFERLTGRLAEFGNRVTVSRVHGQTFEDLRLALNEHEPHIFHFVGHGLWDDEFNDGAIAFADAQGLEAEVSGRDLGVLLTRPALRLVVFNSCNAARTSHTDRFAGVAGSLVAQGVPAAVGMQYPIEDRSATAFGAEFIAKLVESRSIDHALSEARTAVYTAENAIEWATPVFTTRVAVDDIIHWA